MITKDLDVLLVDDSGPDARVIERYCSKIDDFNITLHHTTSAREGRSLIDEIDVDLLLLDYRLKGGTGVEFLEELRSSGFYLPVIMVTGKGGEKIATDVLRAGGDDYLSKEELSPEVIRHSIHSVLSDQQLRLKEQAIESISDGVLLTDNREPDNPVVYCNRAFEEMTGYEREEILGKAPFFLKGEETSAETLEKLSRALRDETAISTEILHYRKDGTPFWCHVTVDPLISPNGKVTNFVYIQKDISEMKHKEKQLQETLYQKKLLLQEVHHRVKNNLQIIVSLLRLQSQTLDDETLIELLGRTKSRIFSMAQIHDHLYQSDDTSRLEFDDYLRDLVQEILTAHSTKDRVDLDYQMDSCQLDLDKSVPLGLIVNELVVNAIEHGLKGGGGTIALTFRQQTDRYQLTIRDNGRGFSDVETIERGNTLGFRIVKNLAEGQLRGSFRVSNEDGAKIQLEIPK